MKLLAWDTSSKAGAIVALEWDPDSASGWDKVRLVSEWSLNVDSQHSERLLWGIHQVLESARWRLDEVDLLGVGLGPGSFTGLRIGITTARTLSHSLRKPLVGVSSLAALARPAARWLTELGQENAWVIAATDACKGELFTLWGSAKAIAGCVTVPQGEAEGLWRRGASETVVGPEELMHLVLKKLDSKTGNTKGVWAAVGEGRNRYPEAWNLLPARREIRLPGIFSEQVQGRYLGMLVWEAYQAGLAREGTEIHPRYVRASDAEIKLKSGRLKPAPLVPAVKACR